MDQHQEDLLEKVLGWDFPLFLILKLCPESFDLSVVAVGMLGHGVEGFPLALALRRLNPEKADTDM